LIQSIQQVNRITNWAALVHELGTLSQAVMVKVTWPQKHRHKIH